MSRAMQQRLVFFGLAVLMSVHFAMTYARTLPNAWSSLHMFAYGPVDTPYRPRLLMRWVYAFGYRLSHDQPPRFAHGAMSAMEVTLFLIVLPSLLAIIYLTRASIALLVGKVSAVGWMSLLTVYMCCYQYLLTPQNRAQFPYDLPGVAAFAIGIYAILSNKRWLYYPVLVIGTFNRETTLFLPLLFVVLGLDMTVPFLPALRRMSVWRWAEAAVQLAVWAAIVHWCNVTTDATRGVYALPKNLHFIAEPVHWSTLLSIYGFLWVPYVIFFRRIGHVNLQRVTVLFPLWFVAMIWKADLLEIRVQSEWVPYLCICLALIARNMLLVREDTVLPGQAPVALPGTALL